MKAFYLKVKVAGQRLSVIVSSTLCLRSASITTQALQIVKKKRSQCNMSCYSKETMIQNSRFWRRPFLVTIGI